jgi:hypothetical protein
LWDNALGWQSLELKLTYQLIIYPVSGLPINYGLYRLNPDILRRIRKFILWDELLVYNQQHVIFTKGTIN